MIHRQSYLQVYICHVCLLYSVECMQAVAGRKGEKERQPPKLHTACYDQRVSKVSKVVAKHPERLEVEVCVLLTTS